MCGCSSQRMRLWLNGKSQRCEPRKRPSETWNWIWGHPACLNLVYKVEDQAAGAIGQLDLLSTRSIWTESLEHEAASQKSPTSTQLSWQGLWPFTRQAAAASLSITRRTWRSLSISDQVLRAIGHAKISSWPMYVCFGRKEQSTMYNRSSWYEINENSANYPTTLLSTRNVRGVRVGWEEATHDLEKVHAAWPSLRRQARALPLARRLQLLAPVLGSVAWSPRLTWEVDWPSCWMRRDLTPSSTQLPP